MPRFYNTCAGPIADLYLPSIAWDVLRRENNRTSSSGPVLIGLSSSRISRPGWRK